MISYILACHSELNSDAEDRQESLNNEEIMQGLGPVATEADAILFSKLWKARFHDCTAQGFNDGLPVFYDHEDREACWAELTELLHE